jgi:hypothetical protein
MTVILTDYPIKGEYERQLRCRYEEDESLRRKADAIHERRMLPPPTCDDCIEIALAKRLEKVSKE